MLCPAAGAAAGAGWLLAVLTLGLGLGPGLPLSADRDPGFSLCSHSFYRQSPPVGFSDDGLSPLCHKMPGGQEFATLYSPTCDTAVYSAFHLRRGREEEEEEGEAALREDKQEEEPSGEAVEDEVPQMEVPQVVTPALLHSGGGESAHSPLHSWDSLVTEVVQDTALPKCSSIGGDLYVLTGARGAGSGEGEGEGCESKVYWSAVCCAGPEGESGFNVGLIRNQEGEERVVSVRELEEAIGVTELFSGADEEKDGGGVATLFAEALAKSIEKQKTERIITDITEEDPSIEDQSNVDLVTSESHHSSDNNETLDSESESESSSTLVYVLSSSVYLLTAPLRPVVSTITQLPGQVTYVLQEDLGVLAALPGDTFSLFHLMGSDLVSGLCSVKDLLVDLGEIGVSSLYACTAPLVETLFNSCQIGVVGMGTLAGDGVGIVEGMVDNAWWVTSFFGGRLWEQSEGYMGAVVSEVGGQATTVGGGLGTLVWRCGNGVKNVANMGLSMVVGGVEMVVGTVTEAFGQD